MIPRDAARVLLELSAGYPVLAITGPRQSGKTTLARSVFPDHPYLCLENPETHARIERDPRGFFEAHPDGAIIDEAQRNPELFAWLQGIVDEARRPAHFVLTGSSSFGLRAGITQSLAGRVALVDLLPFSAAELARVDRLPATLDETLQTGAYPPIHDRHLDPGRWCANYVQTYLERDVRQLVNVRSLSTFHRFLRLCAGRTGQLLNLSALGDAAGVSHNTAREWISVLEASFIVHRLPPHHQNFRKRLVKTPKLYFLDTGLAAWLLGIETHRQLETHPLRGALFETWVVAEFLKARFNTARPSNASFWRDHSGHEVDLLLESGGVLHAIEIKSGATLHADALRGLKRWAKLSGQAQHAHLVFGGAHSSREGQVEVIAWRDLATRATALQAGGPPAQDLRR